MKLLLVSFAIIVLANVAFARFTYLTPPTSLVFNTTASGYYIPVAATKDLFLFLDVAPSVVQLAITRRDSNGAYQRVAYSNISTTFFSTNGKWIALHDLQAKSASFFSIDNQNTLSSTSKIQNIKGGFLLSDDTFVTATVDQLSSNTSIVTYEYNAQNQNWTLVAGAEVTTSSALTTTTNSFSTYRATASNLVFVDHSMPGNVSAQLYQRMANRSWSFIESVPINGSATPASIDYNGADTLVLSLTAQDGNFVGFFFTYTKINGKWHEQIFTGSSLGYRPAGYLALQTFFVNPTTLIVSAALEGYAGGNSFDGTGKVLVLLKGQDGLWMPAVDMVANHGLFGIGLAVNDDYILSLAIAAVNSAVTAQLYAAPLCFLQPINVTCTNKQATDCSSAISTQQLYTVNNPQCGAVTASMNGFSLVNNQAIMAQLTFTRGYGNDAFCNATITCPAPPVPPVNVNVPTGKVSVASVLQLGAAALIASLVVFV